VARTSVASAHGGATVPAATDYPLLDIFWTMILVFLWVAWIWLLFYIFGDIFRRRDIGGWSKAMWSIFVILVPFLGTFVYIIAQGRGMTERSMQQAVQSQQQFDAYVQNVAASSSSADQIQKAKDLLDRGVISAQEFDRLKQNALGAH
jgi:hypothetical protein